MVIIDPTLQCALSKSIFLQTLFHWQHICSINLSNLCDRLKKPCDDQSMNAFSHNFWKFPQNIVPWLMSTFIRALNLLNTIFIIA